MAALQIARRANVAARTVAALGKDLEKIANGRRFVAGMVRVKGCPLYEEQI